MIGEDPNTDDIEDHQHNNQENNWNTKSEISIGPIFSFIKNIWPSLATLNKYKDKFRKILTKEDYALDLKITSISGLDICKFEGDSILLTKVFKSQTEINTGFMPYAGNTSKKVRKSQPYTKKIKHRLEIENSFHNNNNFHEEFINVSILRRDNGRLKEVTSDNKSKYLYNYLLNRSSNNKINSNILITGDIGCGKSTFIANVAHKIISYNKEAISKRPEKYIRKEPIFLDVDKLLREEILNTKASIYNAVIKEITKKIKDQCEISGETLDEVLSDLINKEVILIIDNLDYIYYTFCSHLYHEEFFNEEEVINEYFPFLFSLINDFTRGRYSEYGITCIYVARKDTKKIINYGMGHKDNGGHLIDNIDLLVNVGEMSPKSIESIIKKRFILSESLVKEGKDSLSRNIRKYNNQTENLHIISNLSTHGLRHVISLYRALSWTVYTDEVFERFFLNVIPPMIYLFLGGKSNYSQINEGMVNIFLINNEYRKLEKKSSNHSSNSYPEHMHTYWLKYYILLFIHHNNATLTEVKNVFSQRSNRLYAYEKSIVETVLLSLSEFEHGRLIRPKIHTRGKGRSWSTDLLCTKKGEYLINEETFFSFWYLALVIEDEWLQFPDFCFKKFSRYMSFDFLFDTNLLSYHKKLIKLIILKVPLVLEFIDILEISHQYEKDKCKDIFKDNIFTNGVQEPDFGKIRSRIKHDVCLFTSSFTEKDKAAIEKAFVNYQLKRTGIRKSLKTFFEKVYHGGFFNREVKRKIAMVGSTDKDKLP